MKNTVDEIRERFDRSVERFSSLETGQVSIMDAPVLLDLLAGAAAGTNPDASDLLDIGCGAGNNSLKVLQLLPRLNVMLVDLSRPMLKKAAERIQPMTSGCVTTEQGDIRTVELGKTRFDIMVAAAVFHHLRTDEEWRQVFAKCFAALRPGGSLWISDLVEHASPPVAGLMRRRYGAYLERLEGEEYRDAVLACIEEEDTPRTLLFQIELLREVGFQSVEILHKNGCFAAFGAVRQR